MKDKLGKRIFKNSFLFFLYLFLIELIVRYNVGSSFWNWESFRIALSSLIIAILIGVIISLNKKIIRNILATIISSGIMIYAWIEINLFFYLGFFMGTGNAEQGTKVFDYIKDYIKASKFSTYLVIIPFIILMVYYWYLERKIKVHQLNKTIYFKFEIERPLNKLVTSLTIVLITVLLSISYYISLEIKFMQNPLQSIKNKSLFVYPDNSNLSVSQFGFLVYGATDIISQVFNIDVADNFEYLYKNPILNKEVTDYTKTIDDYSWNELISRETKETYNKLNNYFINREITPKNEYTGLFADKNLIVILMESVNEIAIDQTLFPNIYKLYSEGMSFRNNYTPRNSCSTGNNEMTVMTSLYTINNTCTANTYKNNTYFEAIFNQFNNLDYATSSYHNYAEFYYARRTIHPNMGSGKYYNVSDLGIKWSSVYQEWPSDVDLIEKAVPNFINEEKFMVFLTTVTTHQPYSVYSTNGDKHLSELADYDYSKSLKRYLSKMKELDAALGLLLQKLEESGKLDDTVIALFGDHYPYGLTTSQINEFLDYDVTINKEVDRTPLIIYNSAQEPKQVYKYTAIIDLLPTLLNLFNVNYDPRLYFGHDIFSEYDDRTIFADGSWQDEVGYYSATSGRFKPANEEEKTYTSEELLNINSEINAMQKMSALAIKNNYFSYLKKGTDKYPKEINEVIDNSSGNFLGE